MNVLLNVEPLSSPLNGIGTYTFQLARRLGGHADITSLALISRNGLPRSWFIPSKVRQMLRRVPYAYELRDEISAYLFRRARYADQDYVYHEPSYIPVRYEGAFIITVSDLSHRHYPAYHPSKRVRWLERNLARSIATAKQIICHSQFIRDELVATFGVAPDKVNVVYHGVSDEFRPRTVAESETVLRRYDLEPDRYLLSVGTLEPRKNLVGLIRAFSGLPQQLRREFPLVVVGTKGWHTNGIQAAMAPFIEDKTLHWLGYVPMEDLPTIYAGARALAYPSFYEGFGLPVIEAMASGVPVLTSNRAALPEIAGDSATLIDPDSFEDIANGMRQVLLDEDFRKASRARGLERAKGFRWDTAVDETVRVYRKALDATRG